LAHRKVVVLPHGQPGCHCEELRELPLNSSSKVRCQEPEGPFGEATVDVETAVDVGTAVDPFLGAALGVVTGEGVGAALGVVTGEGVGAALGGIIGRGMGILTGGAVGGV